MNDSGALDFNVLQQRAAILRSVRAFFDAHGFCEVETPIRIPAPANEAFLEPPPAGQGRWLRTSPELHMKRLLAQGVGKIYQMGACFREAEIGSRHNPEFTLLEWYRPNETIDALYTDVAALVSTVLGQSLTPTVIRVAEIYREVAGWDPLEAWDEDRFDEDMALKIEPALPKSGLTYLIDYPAPAAALARLNPNDPRVAERFEAYLNGIEIANGYGELTDATEQRQRFEATIAMRQSRGLPTYPLDEPFLAALPAMPPTAGIALGIDRLVMLACGKTALSEVRPFCELR
jgi:lysyl-tRNA synthetase class 2